MLQYLDIIWVRHLIVHSFGFLGIHVFVFICSNTACYHVDSSADMQKLFFESLMHNSPIAKDQICIRNCIVHAYTYMYKHAHICTHTCTQCMHCHGAYWVLKINCMHIIRVVTGAVSWVFSVTKQNEKNSVDLNITSKSLKGCTIII